MDNRFNTKKEKCPLIGKYCDKNGNCNKCISKEEEYKIYSNCRGGGKSLRTMIIQESDPATTNTGGIFFKTRCVY